ncbi:MAG: hypothetical protein ACKO7V_04645, partial [Bacteroidota bacterium]
GRAGFCSQRRRSCIATPTGGAADGLQMRPRKSGIRARAPPQNKIKFALGLMIVCSRQKKVCSKFNVGLQTMKKVYIDARKVYIQD